MYRLDVSCVSQQIFSKVIKSDRLTDYEKSITNTKLTRGLEMRYGNLLMVTIPEK